jgi:hypothetical protein
MIRLRKIEISGFRGALNSLPIDFGSQCQSLAIFGENATGKSSITDAIEWFYTDRIGHLWKESCKEDALRNVLLPQTAPSQVSLNFSRKDLDCKKTLSHLLTSSFSNKGKDFDDYLKVIQEGQERLALRNIDLLTFILSTKTEKRQYLAKIIGYEALDGFREIIGRTQAKLESSADYVASNRNLPEYQKDIFKIVGSMISNHAELFGVAQHLAADAGVSSTIMDDESYTKAISEIRTRIGEKEKAAKQLIFAGAKRNCELLVKKAKEANDSYDRFSAIYKELIKSEEELRQIKLESFLSQGKKAIDDCLVATDLCPLCLQPKPWSSLKSELEVRITRLEESKKRFEVASTQKGQALASLNEAAQAGKDLIESAAKAGLKEDFLKVIRQYNSHIGDLVREIIEKFDTYQPVSLTHEQDTLTVCRSVQEESNRLSVELEALKLSEEEQKLLDAVRNLETLRTTFQKFLGASQTVQNFQNQIKAMSVIRTKFNVVHAATLQKALDLMSSDISRYYLTMHPNEYVDDIKLTVLEEGVEFEYGFHGKRVHPPLKYLSESHLNSLGIAAFLASAKLFNKVNGFFVLDDVVTSFDANHRIRLLRLLKSQFSDWQILLLTHEPIWFEMIKTEMAPQGWLISELEVLPGAQVQIKGSPRSLKEQIVHKKEAGTLTANDLRTCLERILKEISLALEVKMAFRYNDENERRMPGEMLSELRSRLKKHSLAILSEPVFASLPTSNLVGTTGSHDSGPVLSTGDIAVAFEDIFNLDGLFCCENCGGYVSVNKLRGQEAKIYCNCGKKDLEWKD